MPLNLQNNVETPSRDETKAQLLARLPEVLHHLYPVGVIRRQEFEIGNIKGDKGKSMKIALRGDKAGLCTILKAVTAATFWISGHSIIIWTLRRNSRKS